MARGEKKNTIGAKMESAVRRTAEITSFGAGSLTSLYLTGAANTLNDPESMAAATSGFASIVGGLYTGSKISQKLEGEIADRVDDLKPSRLQNAELYLDKRDPFDIGIDRSDIETLDDVQKRQMENSQNRTINEYDLNVYVQRQLEEGQAEEWVENLAFDEINGFKDRYRTSPGFSGDFKHGYVGENEEIFVQAPKEGDTFQETLERVQAWKKNKETLDQADRYLDQVLSNTGTKTVSEGAVDIEIEYDFLHENEELLREEVEYGIMTPSESYDIVITSYEGDPLPVLVGEYKPDMIENGNEMRELENSEEVYKRKKVLGMYMDTLIEEGEFEGYFGDFWHSEGHGRKHTKNMFYDQETDTVGVADIGELNEGEIETPEVSIESRYT